MVVLECRTASSAEFTDKVILRSELYKYYLKILGFRCSSILMENTGEYSTLCFETSSNTKQDYINDNVKNTSYILKK